MRIPLDYYRILGLPIQATAEQLRQAHRDRMLQLPRREYSEAAIASRRHLLDEAYAVLSDLEQRKDYDARFLATTYELDAETAQALQGPDGEATELTDGPSIEIDDQHLVGALLILQELGEYELVLKLGRSYLGSDTLGLKQGRFGEPAIARADIVLTVARAQLELGREHWQQGQYENAAASLQMGQELLQREGAFNEVQAEILSDLHKLRPYRILELLALPETSREERRQGLQLLQAMLQARGGIDGTGDDQSGLSIDDFLRFIQQLRDYLTAAEQQALFEAEADRPSAVATYLAVYALLGRGFAERQPALIRRAKRLLMRLGSRQDVHLEQGVCALLLGQTEEASRALELSQEYEPLAFIREHSQGSPDMLPGLCLYAERWLQSEVFQHFRDLAQDEVSLKDYFADEQVQAYLEALPSDAEEDAVPMPRRSQAARSSVRPAEVTPPAMEVTTVPSPRSMPTATATPTPSAASTEAVPMPPAVRVGRGTKASDAPAKSASPDSSLAITRREGSLSVAEPSSGGRRRREDRVRGQLDNGYRVPDLEDLPPRRPGGGARRSPKIGPLLLLVAIALLVLGGTGWAITRVVSWLGSRDQAASSGANAEPLLVQLDRPILEFPPELNVGSESQGALNSEMAKAVINSWLAAKSLALSEEHSRDRLAQILVNPALAEWDQRAIAAERDGWHWKYQHELSVESVQVSPDNPNQASVEAQVREKADFYEQGTLNTASSYDDNLRVRYDLVRQEGEWRIQDMVVLN